MGYPGFRMNSLGDAWIDVHGNTDPFERETERGVRRGAEEAEDEAREGGDDLGEVMAESMGDRLRASGPQLAREIEGGLNRQRIRTKVTVQLDKEGNVVRQWVSTITDEIKDAFNDSDGPTGFLKKFQLGFSDLIGAGFNVSGRSPLIALLIPLVGVIGGLIVGALQAVNALVAVLAAVPGLIAAIGLQVGIVAVAFQGLGTAVEGAFAAKNARELEEALKDLTPAAQRFVKQLLVVRDWFNQFQDNIQENFFRGLGELFGERGALTPLLRTLDTLGPTAASLGAFFGQLLSFFGSPIWQSFIQQLLPTIDRFLKDNGPALNTLFTGITMLAITALPFMERLGSEINASIEGLGRLLTNASQNPGTETWLDRMYKTLLSIKLLIESVINFTKTLLDELDKAGGRKVIDTFTEAIDRLTFFLQTPVGQKALEGIINLTIISIQVFTGLIISILTVIAAVEFAGEAIGAFLAWVWDGVKWLWDKITGLFGGAEDQIKTALGNVDNFLFDSGKRIIQGLINGIKAMVPNVKGIMTTVTAAIRGFWPFSPAKEGPLAGAGDPMIAGKNIIDRLAMGITAGSQDLGSVMNQSTSNIVFGPGSVNVGFEGVVPTQQQAMQTGMAVGQGALSILSRNTRLAVRTA